MNTLHAMMVCLICIALPAGPAAAQHDDHEADATAHANEHGHPRHDAEPGASPEVHDPAHHADDEHADGDGHDHGEEASLNIDSATMEEFGIMIEQASPGTLGKFIRLPGEVVFNADRIAHVTPSVAGIVQEVDASVGDRVVTGDVLAVLRSRELAAARSEYLAAQARLSLAQEVLQRDERLLADRVGTERQVLEARQSVKDAEIALHLAEQNLHALGQTHEEIASLGDMADTEFNHYELKAPIDGVIIARELARGEVVSEQPDPSPFVIADPSSVWVNLTVYQRDLAEVEAGMAVQIQFGHGIPSARGTIAFVSPSLDKTTRTATARVVLDNPNGVWRPGLFVNALVDSGDEQAGIVVPRSAITELEGRRVVFVQTDNGFEPRPVQIGRTTEERAEIRSGLRRGDRYVARNVLALKAEMNRGALEHAGHAH